MRRWLAIGLLLALSAALPAAETGVLRFWWNRENPTDGRINGIADRENFFPMLLDIRPFVDAWSGGGVSFRLRGNGAVNVAWTSMSRSDVWALYRSDEVGAGEGFSTPLDSAPVVQVTPSGIDIPDGVLRRIRSGGDVVLACEVRPGASTGIVQFEAVAGANTLFRFPMGCYASDVTNMYHWVNLRHVSGQEEEVPTMAAPPGNADWSEDLPHVFFVHGANVGEAESRVWCEKIFKRLYLSGAKMRFHGVSWRSQVDHAYDYHLNASNAFDVASSLADVVNSYSGRKIVMAHSLGTMVASSAIQDHGMQVDKLLLLNSAIPSEAFDASLFDVNPENPLVHGDWILYPSACWTACWSTLFPDTDARRLLTWKNRFNGIGPSVVNFFSSGDEVFEIFADAHNPSWYNGVSPSGHWGDRYAWQKQELWKGRRGLAAHLGTTYWSGWGFRKNMLGLKVWSADEARAIVDTRVFSTNTVFATYPETITNSVASRLQPDYHLAQGIPALSRATGATGFRDLVIRSFDVNDEIYRVNGWPTEEDDGGDGLGGRFLHSDIKNVAYFFTHQIFMKIIEEAGLR